MKGSRGCGRVSEFLSPHGMGAGQQPLSLIQVQRLQNLQPGSTMLLQGPGIIPDVRRETTPVFICQETGAKGGLVTRLLPPAGPR